jgi:CheY-like chemotaxis protein
VTPPVAVRDRLWCAVTAEPQRFRILVVDDNPALARAMRRMLSEHDTTTVHSGREALALLGQGERYDVILTDVMMPEMSGMDLYAEVSQLAHEQIEHMVFMSAGAFQGDIKAFFERVSNPTIEKPFDRIALKKLLARFRPRRAGRSARSSRRRPRSRSAACRRPCRPGAGSWRGPARSRPRGS